MIQKFMKKFMILMALVTIVPMSLKCAEMKPQEESFPRKMLNGTGRVVGKVLTTTGDVIDSVHQSNAFNKFELICSVIAGYTIFEMIKKVGIRSAMKILISKPMRAPLAGYFLSPLVVNVLAWGYEKVAGSSFNYESVSFGPMREAAAKDFYEKRDLKCKILLASIKGFNLLQFASLMCFLTVAQPLSVSASSTAKILA